MHTHKQEEAEVQFHCVDQWEKNLKPHLPDTDFTRALTKHFHGSQDVIKKYGRFPERNEALARESTRDEQVGGWVDGWSGWQRLCWRSLTHTRTLSRTWRSE
jgi:hypothetical protein